MRIKSYVGGATQQSRSYSLAGERVHTKQTLPLPFQYNNNNNNIYLLQLGCNPVAVVMLHVYKT